MPNPEPRQARHAGTLGSGIDAAVLGVYVHCLLLSTGSILVPIVAHAVFDAILFVAEHVSVSGDLYVFFNASRIS